MSRRQLLLATAALSVMPSSFAQSGVAPASIMTSPLREVSPNSLHWPCLSNSGANSGALVEQKFFTPKELAAVLTADIYQWAALIKARNIKAER